MANAKYIQSLATRAIYRDGAVVTLAKNPKPKKPLRAIKVDDQKRISRYMGLDGMGATEKVPVVFVFDGALYDGGGLAHDDEFLYGGMPYKVDSLHPVLMRDDRTKADVCTELPLLAYRS